MRIGAAPTRTKSTVGRLARGFLCFLLVFTVFPIAVLPVAAQELHNPRRLTTGPGRQLIVTDRHLDYIVGLDKKSLEVLWRVQLPGAPYGIARHHRRLFVGDTAAQNVLVYRIVPAIRVAGMALGRAKELKFLYTLGRNPPGQPGYLRNPTDLAIDPRARRVFVLDSSDKKIKVYSLRGRFKYEFYPRDSNGRVLNPVALAVDRFRRELLVSDYGDFNGFSNVAVPARILIYDLRGSLLKQIDGDGSTSLGVQFLRPQGLTTDFYGNIYVAESLTGRILVLNRMSGALAGSLGVPGTEPGQLRLPVDLLLDSRTGDLFVANSRGARRLDVFRAPGRR